MKYNRDKQQRVVQNKTVNKYYIQHPKQITMTMATTTNAPRSSPPQHVPAYDCLSCRVIGTGALGATGLYALNQARAHQPGSRVGKQIMAGVGVLFLLGSVARWRA